MNVANRVLWRMAIILKTNKVNLFVSSVFLFSGTFTEHFRHTTYMELPVKPQILTSYIYKSSCGTVVCKHFASYQGYPNYRWDLIRYAKG
jgi:hypothetical protein